MNREQTIERMCKLVTKVGDEVFKNKLAHDCFCNPSLSGIPVVEDEVIKFIESAVNRAIRKYTGKEEKYEN